MRRLYVAAMAVFRAEFPEHPCLELAPFNEAPFLQWAPDAYARVCLRRGARKSLAQQLEEAQKEIDRLKGIIAAVPVAAVAQPAAEPPTPPPTPEPQETVQVAGPVLSTGRTVYEVLEDWETLEPWHGHTTRQLDAILKGLGQRISRTRRVVCGVSAYALGSKT